VIVGSRTGRTIEVTGSSEGLDPGAVLRPWFKFPGQTSYSEGSARIPVSEDGTFSWQRRTGKKIYVFVQTPDGSSKSKAIAILPR